MYVPFAGDIKYVQQTNEHIMNAILKAIAVIIKKQKLNRPGYSQWVAEFRKLRYQGF